MTDSTTPNAPTAGDTALSIAEFTAALLAARREMEAWREHLGRLTPDMIVVVDRYAMKAQLDDSGMKALFAVVDWLGDCGRMAAALAATQEPR